MKVSWVLYCTLVIGSALYSMELDQSWQGPYVDESLKALSSAYTVRNTRIDIDPGYLVAKALFDIMWSWDAPYKTYAEQHSNITKASGLARGVLWYCLGLNPAKRVGDAISKNFKIVPNELPQDDGFMSSGVDVCRERFVNCFGFLSFQGSGFSGQIPDWFKKTDEKFWLLKAGKRLAYISTIFNDERILTAQERLLVPKLFEQFLFCFSECGISMYLENDESHTGS